MIFRAAVPDSCAEIFKGKTHEASSKQKKTKEAGS